jgi:hypothetical protein
MQVRYDAELANYKLGDRSKALRGDTGQGRSR